MRDYKGRGNNLQFRERSGNRYKRLAKYTLILVMLVIASLITINWLEVGTSSSSPNPSQPNQPSSKSNSIPLDLPPPLLATVRRQYPILTCRLIKIDLIDMHASRCLPSVGYSNHTKCMVRVNQHTFSLIHIDSVSSLESEVGP